jgi:hypothetical protein
MKCVRDPLDMHKPKTCTECGAPALQVECWCQRAVVIVSVPMVKAGWTRSCGRPGCEQT